MSNKCGGCHADVRTVYIFFGGGKWHNECFRCQHKPCSKRLNEKTAYLAGVKPYCDIRCAAYYAEPEPVVKEVHTCASCSKTVTGEITKALGRTWHPLCFTCNKCGNRIKGSEFFVSNDAAYCSDRCSKGGPVLSPATSTRTAGTSRSRTGSMNRGSSLTRGRESSLNRGAVARDGSLNRGRSGSLTRNSPNISSLLGQPAHKTEDKSHTTDKDKDKGHKVEEKKVEPKPWQAAGSHSGGNSTTKPAAAGERCGKCHGAFEGEGKVVRALGRAWHPACFTCASCDTRLEGGFVDWDNTPFCNSDCAEEKICGACNKLLLGDSPVVTLKGEKLKEKPKGQSRAARRLQEGLAGGEIMKTETVKVHSDCVRCVNCRKGGEGEGEGAVGGLALRSGRIYCASCDPVLVKAREEEEKKKQQEHQEQQQQQQQQLLQQQQQQQQLQQQRQSMLPWCEGCQQKIESGTLIKALGGKWHPGCFVCNKCRKQIGSEGYIARHDKAFCSGTCADAK